MATWPLVCDELTAVHVLQPDEVFLPPKHLLSAAQTPLKVGQCGIDASAPWFCCHRLCQLHPLLTALGSSAW